MLTVGLKGHFSKKCLMFIQCKALWGRAEDGETGEEVKGAPEFDPADTDFCLITSLKRLCVQNVWQTSLRKSQFSGDIRGG